jgi:hypothetical protein
MNIVLKILISAALIGIISEIGRRNSPLAAFLAALPLVSLLSMIWIYQETHDVQRLAQFSWSVFWYVLPSLVLFLLLPPLLLRFHLSFYPALLLASLATVLTFLLLKVVLARCGIQI